jgi:hypothetical protein
MAIAVAGRQHSNLHESWRTRCDAPHLTLFAREFRVSIASLRRNAAAHPWFVHWYHTQDRGGHGGLSIGCRSIALTAQSYGDHLLDYR